MILGDLQKKMSVWKNRLYLKLRKIDYGTKVEIRGRLIAWGNVSIGDNVRVNSRLRYNPIGGQDGSIIVAHKNGKIVIKNNVGMSNVTIVSQKSVTIESFVLIGGNVRIYDTDFHPIDPELRKSNDSGAVMRKAVIIKKGAFIGAGSIILKGVSVGENSIVGAGSIVTHSIPDNQIWAGNPAKYIRNL